MNVELTYKEVWATLNALDLSEHHEKKGKYTYLSWTDAWQILMEQYPFAAYEFKPETYESNETVMTHCTVKIGNLSRYMWLPVMDNRLVSIKNPTTREIQDARMRCLVKCLAMYGLANYIYRGEDLPDAAKDKAEAKVTEEAEQEVDTSTGYNIKELNGNIMTNCATAQDLLVSMRVEFQKTVDEKIPFKGLYIMNKDEIQRAYDSLSDDDKETKKGLQSLMELGESS